MASFTNAVNLRLVDGGEQVKQGDTASLFVYELLDERMKAIVLDGKEAVLRLVGRKGGVWSRTLHVEGSKVSFTIDEVLPLDMYTVEIVAGGYVFPSDHKTKIKVVKSEVDYATAEVVSLQKLSVEEEIKKQLENLAVQGVDTDRLVALIKEHLPAQALDEDRVRQLITDNLPAGYDDSALQAQISRILGQIATLEGRVDKDTIYDDSELREAVSGLESKVENLPKVDTSKLVSKDELDKKNYLTEHQDLSSYATKEELKEIRGSQSSVDTSHLVSREELESKNYLTKHQDLSEYAKKSEIPTAYNDRDIRSEIEQLKAREDKDTVYDDRDLKRRVSELEQKTDKDTVYDDTAIKERLSTLENKPNVNISHLATKDELDSYAKKSELPAPYDETVMAQRVQVLENKPEPDLSVYATKEELKTISLTPGPQGVPGKDGERGLQGLPGRDGAKGEQGEPGRDGRDGERGPQGLPGRDGRNGEQGPRGERGEPGMGIPQNLTLLGNQLSITGGNMVTLPEPANLPKEIRGTGFPEGKIVADVGTTYVDLNVTNGALKWIKMSGTGNTGWRILIGDTGWRNVPILSKLGNSFLKIRRINNTVSYSFGGLQWGWFGIVRRGGAGYTEHSSDRQRRVRLMQGGGIPIGFRSATSQIGNIFNDNGKIYGAWILGGMTDSDQISFAFTDPVPTDKDIGDIRVSSISYITDEQWPNKLP